MNIKYISRKFLLSCVVQALLFMFLYIGKLPVENFQILTMTILKPLFQDISGCSSAY